MKHWLQGLAAAACALLLLVGAGETTEAAAGTPADRLVGTGDYHSFLLMEDGKLKAFGRNLEGQLSVTNRDWFRQYYDVPLTNVVQAAGGLQHSMALTQDGKVWTWGGNDSGQLGYATSYTVNNYTPKQVGGLENVVSIAAGEKQSLALKADGTVWAWGNSAYSYSQKPVQVMGVTDAAAVTTGEDCAYALTKTGQVWAWGSNTNGCMGNGKTESGKRYAPTLVEGLADVKAIEAGRGHLLVLLSNGQLWGFGQNYAGQLGIGTTSAPVTRPMLITNSVRMMSAGSVFSLAVKQDDTLWSWGDNSYNATGLNTSSGRQLTPAPVGMTDVKTISAGSDHALAVRKDGTVWGWGRNSDNQTAVSEGTTYVPRRLSNLVTITPKVLSFDSGSIDLTFTANEPIEKYKVTSGGYLVCEGKDAFCHHLGVFGSLYPDQEHEYIVTGYAADGRQMRQITVKGRTQKASNRRLIAGEYHTFVYRPEDSKLYAWGFNGYGQLGDGTKTDRRLPAAVTGLNSPEDAAVGFGFSLIADVNNELYAVGRNNYGQLGDGTNTDNAVPVKVKNLDSVSLFSAKADHAVALERYTGRLMAWGNNTYGQLGTGDTISRNEPVEIAQVQGLVDVKAGGGFTLFLQNDGTVWSVGLNDKGQLGDGTNLNSSSLVQVKGLRNIVKIHVGKSHAMALRNDGTLFAWGSNEFGQLGDGEKTHRNLPVQVQVGADVFAIDGGHGHTQAQTFDGSLYAWGYNFSGQLGDGTKLDRALPQRVEGLPAPVEQMSAGGRNALVYLADGTYWAWGNNSYGELGDGTVTYTATPAQVGGPIALSVWANGTAADTVWLTLHSDVPVGTYKVLRDGVLFYEGTGTQITDAGLAAGTTYSYRVEAYDANGVLLGSKTVVKTTAAQ